MKIADYGKAITSYIESPTTAQKLKSKANAETLGRTFLSNGSDEVIEIDFASAEDKAFDAMMKAYKYYLKTGGKKTLRDYMRMSTGVGRKGGGREHFRATGGRVHLAEGSKDIVEPSESMKVDTTTKGLDLFTLDKFKDKAEIYVGAYHNNALPIADIKSALNKFTKQGLEEGTFTVDEAIKVVQDLKSYFVDMAQKQRLRDVIPEGIGTIKREDFQDGTNIMTLDPVFPTQDPTSTDFKPLDVPGAIIPPLAIGAGAKKFKDIFFSKEGDDDKKEIIPSDDKGSNIEPPKGPKNLDNLLNTIELGKATKDIKEIFNKVDKEYIDRDKGYANRINNLYSEKFANKIKKIVDCGFLLSNHHYVPS